MPATGQGFVCVAEHQSAGRGRRGRAWVSPFGQSIFFSLGWGFDLPLARLSGLSLAVGVAVARFFSQIGVFNHGLKWPNDVLIEGKKIAGILVEAGGEMDGPTRAVIGVGINLKLQAGMMQSVDQPWTDLYSELEVLPDRNQMVADLLEELISACLRYQEQGLQTFLTEWREYDRHYGQKVVLNKDGRLLRGRYLGLDSDGGLILDAPEGRSVHHAGEVSMRRQEEK